MRTFSVDDPSFHSADWFRKVWLEPSKHYRCVLVLGVSYNVLTILSIRVDREMGKNGPGQPEKDKITAVMIMDRQQYQVKRSRSEPISLQGFLRPGSQPILTARTATGRDSAVSYTSIVPDVNVLGTVTEVPQNRTPFRSRRAHTFERVRESGSLPHVMGEHRQSPILTMGPQLPTIKIYPAPTVQRHVQRLSTQPSEDSGKSPLSGSKDVPHLAVITQKRVDTPPSQPKNRLAAWMSAGIDDPNTRNRDRRTASCQTRTLGSRKSRGLRSTHTNVTGRYYGQGRPG
ncbi:hypothetical protein Bbelb_407430 [Branchiostoma belcheri]|nr:hypothetical protein Bbelb_407430 [Branchiostoma belcheri]